ncbi:MAG: PKD domain-containing protein [Bacteroidota bacterium]
MKKYFISLLFVLASLPMLSSSCKKGKTTTTPSPVASFTFVIAGMVVDFTNSSTNATNYIWDFGDGSATSSNQSTSHIYTVAGTYTVTLTASNSTGSSNTSKSVTVTSGGSSGGTTAEFWLTNSNKSQLLKKQSISLLFAAGTNSNPTIEVDPAQTYQDIDGFGYTLTGGSAQMINGMGVTQKANLLNELFGTTENSIGISYLRISIGASDLNSYAFSYDDMPVGQTDPTLANFKLDADKASGTGVIPLLKEILAINPNIKILGSPWSAPTWMKTNGSFVGGSLKTEYYSVYAQYFVKYIQQMAAQGITVDAITPQNEPLHDGNDPSMYMTAEQQRDFIKSHLGPAFQAASLSTKIIIYDHNCDKPEYPLTILNDATAKSYVNGSAFHLYNGDISALSTVRNAHPDKGVYFTEQWTGSYSSFSDDLSWNINRVVIGSMRNWSRNALQWNLANNSSYGPHTPGGCTQCKGALTISGSTVSRNSAYYIIAHASKFARPGSIRIASNVPSNLNNVAFKTPDGKKVLIVFNNNSGLQYFNIKYDGKIITTSLTGGAVGTFIW